MVKMPEFFAIGGPNSAFDLANKVADAIDKGDHDLAVELYFAVRDAITSFSVAMALVTSIQDPEKPVIALSTEEQNEAGEHDPGEMLHFLADGFPGGEQWEEIVDAFKKVMATKRADKEISAMPGDLFVSDII